MTGGTGGGAPECLKGQGEEGKQRRAGEALGGEDRATLFTMTNGTRRYQQLASPETTTTAQTLR